MELNFGEYATVGDPTGEKMVFFVLFAESTTLISREIVIGARLLTPGPTV